MSSSPLTEVFHRAARLAVRAGASEIDIDILMLALDFEAGPAQPVDLSKVDALLARYRRTGGESSEPSSRQSFGAGYSSGWIGLSTEMKVAFAPFGKDLDGMTIDSLRNVLLAVQSNKASG
jgi:hypothetical protein